MSHHNYHNNAPSLTVLQLIQQLSNLPANAEVVFEWEDQFICIDKTDITKSNDGQIIINVDGYNYRG